MKKWIFASYVAGTALISTVALSAEKPVIQVADASSTASSDCVPLNKTIGIRGRNINVNETHLAAGKIELFALSRIDGRAADIIESEVMDYKEVDGKAIVGEVNLDSGASVGTGPLLQNAGSLRTRIKLQLTPTGKEDKANLKGTVELTDAQVQAILRQPRFLGKPAPKVCGVGLYLTLSGQTIRRGALTLQLDDSENAYPIEALNLEKLEKNPGTSQLAGLPEAMGSSASVLR